MGALFSIMFDPLVGAYDSLQLGDSRGCRKELGLCRRRVEILLDRTFHSDLDSGLIQIALSEMESFLKIADDAVKDRKYEAACDAMNNCATLLAQDLPHAVLKLEHLP